MLKRFLSGNSILKNSSYLLISQALTKVLSFFYTFFLVRNLAVDEFGLYIAALSYSSLVSALADIGVGRYLTREALHNKVNLPKTIVNVIFLRLLLFFVFTLFFAGLFLTTEQNGTRVILFLLAITSVFPQSFSLTFESIYAAKEKFVYSAIGAIVLNIATVVFGAVTVILFQETLWPILALIVGQIFYAFYMCFTAWRLNLPLLFKLDWNIIKSMLLKSLPYGFLSWIGLMYFRIDALMLFYLKGAYETGIYGAAYKFLEALVFVPTSISAVLFPKLSQLYGAQKKEALQFFNRSTLYLFLLGLPFTFVFVVFLPFVIQWFFPNYEPSIPVLRILALTIPWMFMIIPLGNVVLTANKHLKGVIYLSILNLILNVSLNFLLIPNYSFIGSAWATVISDVFSFIVMFLFIRGKFFQDEKRS